MSLGFIIIRHINSSETDEYWKECYHCIRKYYNNDILIIDDNSNPNFLKEDIITVNCTVIKSEFIGRAELLGYYYFHKTHFVDRAVIIHDSVFLNSYIDFTKYGEVRSLWSFQHHWDEDAYTINIIKKIPSHEVILEKYINKNSWQGCFGVMSMITWNLLDKIDSQHNLFEALLSVIRCRQDRMALERIFACLFAIYYAESTYPCHIINNIHNHGWGFTYLEYKHSHPQLSVVKVWTGR